VNDIIYTKRRLNDSAAHGYTLHANARSVGAINSSALPAGCFGVAGQAEGEHATSALGGPH
jgi:hypothetical protein